MTTRLLLGLFFAFPATLHAAPPKLDYFFPAGAQRGTTVIVTAAGTFTPWPVKVHVDGKGLDVKPAKASGQLAITIAKDAEPGVRWIRLYNDEGASVARPFIVGLLPEITEQEPNDDPQKPQVVAQPSVVINGRLGKTDDVDTFAVKLTKGQTLVASLEAHHTLRSPMDGVMQILSADGFVLEQNDDYHGLDPQIAFTAPKDGTYLVRIFAFPSMPDATVRFAGKETYIYRLTLTTGPYVEYAYPLAVPSSAPSTVELIGWNLPAELRKFPITVRAGVKTLSLFDPRCAGVFEIRQEPHPAIARAKTPLDVTPPVTVTGKIEKRGAVDVYQFKASKGQKLALRIDSHTLGFPLDPVLTVTDPAGKTLNQAKAPKIGADPSLDFTATQDGVYRVEVRDLVNSGSFRHVYRLRIAAPTPDFTLTVAADTFTLSAAKPLEIPVTITRTAGFKDDITLRVEGAPKDVTVTTSPKGITLRTTSKTPSAGAIRIVGVARGGTTHVARATVADFAHTTESLWLNVTAK
jgi:hypothetical protein